MTVHLHDAKSELFSIAFQYAPIGMALLDADCALLHVNASLGRMLGYEESELPGMTLQDLAHPLDGPVARDMVDRLRDGECESYPAEMRYLHKNGVTVWGHLVLSLLRDESAQPFRYIAQIKDITERKFAEQKLSAKTMQLESFIRHNADAIWMIDAEENVVDVNPAFERLFGWSADEIKGKPLLLIPDFLKDAMTAVHRRIKAGETVVGLETVRRCKDGQLLDVEATLSPLRDHNGMIVGITGICRDVSPRKLAEKELIAKASQLESFIEDNADPIAIFDHDSRIYRVNEAFERTFGWSNDEIIGLHLTQVPIIPSKSYPEVDHNYVTIMSGQSIHGFETVRQRKNGELLNVILTASPILDGKDGQSGFSVIFRDITGWKMAQEHMKNAEKLSVAGQLAAGIAHEIRNPITSIKGFVQLMKAGIGEKQKYFDIMTSEIERIELILSELLILAKPQTIKYERKDIRVLLSQVMTLLDSQANLNNVQFTTEIKPGVTPIYCDENQIKQVFINFIKNAIESMPKGGIVRIQVMNEQDQSLRIRLTDEGCGIPEDVLAKLGQPFYTTKETGTGLGFMVSQKIIENHAGSIRVESKVGQGTSIDISLPISI
ncbi:PAS domain S-box protein [Paenibacillus lycopersici]|uniref:histidine kinase n=1 Tax=Paenibacillus lycopersici TaxID=2704462 RepID=A0A6C0FWA9_9BACL|nr:PAS domain S-box protein [Paenibacillus lycopersici]QHT59751.1 PAS domain S-box protein [Paenibacillus lycopersici]